MRTLHSATILSQKRSVLLLVIFLPSFGRILCQIFIRKVVISTAPSGFFIWKICLPEKYTYHYHDFHKLLIFLNGTVSYRVEGREYDLKPGDQVLIPAGEIHCPVVHNSAPYTRLIAYISPEFFSSLSEECDLSGCFSHALNCHDNLIRIPDYFSGTLYPVLED